VKLSILEWHKLHREIKQARSHITAAEACINECLIKYNNQPADKDTTDTIDYLIRLSSKIDDLRMLLGSMDDSTRPVSEWVGDNRRGEGIYCQREPTAAYGGLSARRYFTEDEVKEYEQWRAANPTPTAQ
jgi:hypothetical protein